MSVNIHVLSYKIKVHSHAMEHLKRHFKDLHAAVRNEETRASGELMGRHAECQEEVDVM